MRYTLILLFLLFYFTSSSQWVLGTAGCYTFQTTQCCCQDGNSYTCSLSGNLIVCYPNGFYECFDLGGCHAWPNYSHPNCYLCCPSGYDCNGNGTGTGGEPDPNCPNCPRPINV